jgi:polyisoprenoid-binding protein YceI
MTTTLATIGLALLAAACAGPSGQAVPPAAPIPLTTVSPVGSTSPPTVSTPDAPAIDGAIQAPARSPAESSVRLKLVPGENEARFRAREQLAGRSLPNDAVGNTRDVSGTIVLGPNGAIRSEQSKVLVDLRTLKSDQGRRDNFIKNNTLQTSQFPTAEFVPMETRELASPLPSTGERTFQLVGNLTVHGTTRPARWDVSAHFADQQVAGSAVTTVRLEDFGMSRPTVGPVLSIEETLRLELDFRAALG